MLRIVKEGRICRAGLHSPKYTLTIILVPSSRDCMVTLYNRLPYTTVYGPGNIVRVQGCGRIQQVTISLKRDFLMSGFSGGYFNFFVWGSSSYSKTTASSQGSLLIPNIHSLFHSSLRYFNWDVKFLEPWWNQFSGFGLKWCLAWIWANTSFVVPWVHQQLEPLPSVKVSFCLLSL